MLELILGFILGILASIAAGVRLSFLQFKSSIAGYRVRMVANATREFLGSTPDTGYLSNKYRYSLGVFLDELTQKFGQNTFNEDGAWPVTIDIQHSETKDKAQKKIDGIGLTNMLDL